MQKPMFFSILMGWELSAIWKVSEQEKAFLHTKGLAAVHSESAHVVESVILLEFQIHSKY